jgi:hypothetical protein
MFPLLKSLADVFHVTDAAVHWRLTILLFIGAAVACVIWALIPDRITGTILWLMIVGLATIIGIIWDRKTNGKPAA